VRRTDAIKVHNQEQAIALDVVEGDDAKFLDVLKLHEEKQTTVCHIQKKSLLSFK
jgi:hypothetical protein